MNDRTCNRCKLPLNSGQKKYCSHLCANRDTMEAKSRASQAVEWATCSVDSCTKPARARTASLCKMHYHRLYRYGTLERTTTLVKRGEREPATSPANILGQRYGTLVVAERVGNSWLCICDCGEQRITRTGDLNRTGESNTCGKPGMHLAPIVEYGAAHERVERKHGRASTHPCIDCGKRAYHWSYDHQDQDELVSQATYSAGIAYSLKTEHYEARCVACHKTFDLTHINATRFADFVN
jgi:hypothetical protein